MPHWQGPKACQRRLWLLFLLESVGAFWTGAEKKLSNTSVCLRKTYAFRVGIVSQGKKLQCAGKLPNGTGPSHRPPKGRLSWKWVSYPVDGSDGLIVQQDKTGPTATNCTSWLKSLKLPCAFDVKEISDVMAFSSTFGQTKRQSKQISKESNTQAACSFRNEQWCASNRLDLRCHFFRKITAF